RIDELGNSGEIEWADFRKATSQTFTYAKTGDPPECILGLPTTHFFAYSIIFFQMECVCKVGAFPTSHKACFARVIATFKRRVSDTKPNDGNVSIISFAIVNIELETPSIEDERT
ncbi:hypothetical protein IE077_004130, partial [Cardiosporidium cionae]